jgi:outer membrane PBP1 activator LpoA protein
MIGKTPDRLSKAIELQRAIFEDAQEITPEQARAELIERGVNPDEIAAASRAMANGLLAESRKERLYKAQAEVAQRTSRDMVATRDVGRIRQVLARLAREQSSIAGTRIALAHRNGTSQSDGDVQSLWQDLIDLGAVSDDDLGD